MVPEPEFLHVLHGVAVQLGHLHTRAAAAERLRDSESRFASTMALAAIGISHVGDDGRFLYVNPQLCTMLGYSEAELLARTVKDISHPNDKDTTQELSRQLRDGTIPSFKVEKRYLRKDGSMIWAGLTVALKRDRAGRKLYDVSIVEDISVRKEAERCVQYLASHDALTDLPNRSTFTELLALACETARRNCERVAVLFVDLDRFKIINDTLGHEAGDATLREAARRLRSCVRASDVVARLGGDEFVVLLQNVAAPAAAGKVASNILAALEAPVVIRGEPCTVSASIGICLHPDGDQDDQAVLRNADMAMYLAKQSGKNGYRVYVNELKELAAERASIETVLRGALERGEMTVRYEARVDAQSQAIVGFAARVHWNDAGLAAVAATKLAAVAEAAGLVVPVNQRVLRMACAAAAEWQAAGLVGVPVAVGVSAGQINDPQLMDDVREALRTAGLAPRLLELEVTEDALLANRDRSVRALTALKALGVGIAIDAFGTGRASFADLQRFPLDALEIHHTRLDGIAADTEKQSYAEGVIALGKALGLSIVATGVAREPDAAFLRATGCTALQGPIAPHALAANDCEALLRQPRGGE
jgi:diguanylate cyclase (GGDEF)-like protein/PAS domain S-box-containing protein